MQFYYKPLPEKVDISLSAVEGKGIIAKEYIAKGSMIGITHVKAEPAVAYLFKNGLIRTPLGGYLNHSDNPNCLIQTAETLWYLFAAEDIAIGHELFVDYRLYQCGAPDFDK